MPTRSLHLTDDSAQGQLAAVLAAIPTTLGLARDFPPDVDAEAQVLADAPPLPPDEPGTDRTDIEFVTIDPAGSTDLDQALAIERDGGGWRVFYAIADVPAFVHPGGAIDGETRERGQTIYAADGRIPLHPVVISEGAASLLPDQLRGAFVWDMQLDASGVVTSASVARGRVRSRRQLDYVGAQASLDAGTGPDAAMLGLLRDVGEARVVQEAARGGASLNTPEVLVTFSGESYGLERRAMLPIESWNAQISLMTGMAAAQLMLDGKVGILRTMPPADEFSVSRFRRQATALGRPWPEEQRYGDYLRDLDGTNPQHLAILHAASSLFRGAGYTPFDGSIPENTIQSAVGAPYAHVTAPLRRLVDRFGLAISEALSAGETPPEWARRALPELPKIMARTSNVANQLDRRTLDSVEAALLSGRVGETFDAVVVSRGKSGATVQLTDPDVEATLDDVGTGTRPDPGTDVRVRLDTADVATGTVRFSVA
ncbi:RNB domain-containing ribonuclease [soil metagenome]